jgi:tight adherence protein B
MPPYVLTILTFGAGVSAVAGAYSLLSDLVLRDRRRVGERMAEEFQKQRRERARRSMLYKDLGQLAAEAGLDEEAAPTVRRRFEDMIEQSGLDLTARKLLLTMAGTGGLLGLLAMSLGRGPLAAIVLAATGAVAPLFYVHYKRNARMEKLLSQLPDAFDLMGRVIRAGQTMSQALQAVADEFPQPISMEFGYCYEQQNLGLTPEFSLRDLARRTGLVEIQIFVMALLVQQQTGGNLAELLDKLSAIIRARYKLRGQVKALTAEGRMQAVVLLGLPPALFLVMLVLNRDYAATLLQFPMLIGTTLALEGIGALWIRKIVNFQV